MKNKVSTKALAEAILRQLPAVMGASVREDINGYPREVHLLIAPGPNPRDLARNVRKLLQERLGIEIDQRVISIAQLSRELNLSPTGAMPEIVDALSAEPTLHAPANAAPEAVAHNLTAPRTTATTTRVTGSARARTNVGAVAPPARVIYQGVESASRDGRLSVRVRISWQGSEYTGEGEELMGGQGRIRAAASATLAAAMEACASSLRLDLEYATTTRALGREYVIITARAAAPILGRKPLTLIGAQPIEFDTETATALATLHAVNRILARFLQQ